jgi:hypothetical protein
VDDAFHPTCKNTAYNDTSSIYERLSFSVTSVSELVGNMNSLSSVKLLAAEPKCRSPSMATHPTLRDKIFTGEKCIQMIMFTHDRKLMKIIALSDLHNDHTSLSKIGDTLFRVDLVLLVGDLTNGGPAQDANQVI